MFNENNIKLISSSYAWHFFELQSGHNCILALKASTTPCCFKTTSSLDLYNSF